MPLQDFDALRAARKTAAPKEPLVAKIGGREFRFAPEPSVAGTVEARSVLAEAEEKGDYARVLVSVIGWLYSTVLPEDRHEFERVLTNEDDPITGEDIAAIFLWLCGEYAKQEPGEKPEPTAPTKPSRRTSRDELERILSKAPPHLKPGEVAG